MNNTVNKVDWVAQGKFWESVPPRVKRMVAEYFTIPQELEFELLPSPHLSIAKMLDFPLPTQNNMIMATQPAQFFSINWPDITDKDLLIRTQGLPIPDSKTMHKLVACSRQSWLDGNQSVMYSHLGGNRDVWIPWCKAQEWVKNNKKIITKNPTHAALAKDTAVMLAMLPWELAKRGLSDSEPFHSLWRFLGTHWLSGSQMNDMVEILRYKINSDPELVKNTRVAGIELLPKILAAHRAADAGTYWTEQGLHWIRDRGDDLVQKNAALITSAHLGPVTDEQHWVSIVVDCLDEVVVHYGDSFATPIPEEMRAALRWWLGQHTPKDVRFTDLPIACQTDSFSCCFFIGFFL
ncbi:hypothetical protein DFH08DRAFT_1012113 [Mycena albidolilacea]|uniref:Ubiquitin-like protease family profile domain-containing protein n=1 Tax=Mycena albidolilacea TaxID=1033008 RepID=A0AAD6ZVK0_9AGAR|nr:hypothetical protein DFH08DRAFT_1012113 [Mycena albidolilacea]